MIHRPLQDRYLVPEWEVEAWALDKMELYGAMVIWSVHGPCADCRVWWFQTVEEALGMEELDGPQPVCGTAD